MRTLFPLKLVTLKKEKKNTLRVRKRLILPENNVARKLKDREIRGCANIRGKDREIRECAKIRGL